MDVEQGVEMAELLKRENLIEQWTIEGQQQTNGFDCGCEGCEDYYLRRMLLDENFCKDLC